MGEFSRSTSEEVVTVLVWYVFVMLFFWQHISSFLNSEWSMYMGRRE